MKSLRKIASCALFAIAVVMFCGSNVNYKQPDRNVHRDWLQFGQSKNWNSSIALRSEPWLSAAWNIEVGEGRSQVVGIGNEIYVTSGSSSDVDGKTRVTSRIAAIDCVRGIERWVFEQSSMMHDNQETFNGSIPAPQATPTIAGDFLITIGFTGQLTCLNRVDGTLVWQKDLVKDFGAFPVQYGFAVSPIVDLAKPDRVCIVAAGKSGGIYCLEVKNGSVVWKSECNTIGYATPVDAKFGNVEQWIVISEREIVGIAKSDGSRLWEFAMPDSKMINAASPIVVDDHRLVVSGNGCLGTRCLAISRDKDQWMVEEEWFQRKAKFYYQNWMKLTDRTIIGCTEKFMAVLDTNDGSILARWREFPLGNITKAGQHLLVHSGNGNVDVLKCDTGSEFLEIINQRKFKVIDARCWTPISIVGDRMFVRGNDRLVCLMSTNQGNGNLENLLDEPFALEFEQGLLNGQNFEIAKSNGNTVR